jgi:hypothetical protein
LFFKSTLRNRQEPRTFPSVLRGTADGTPASSQSLSVTTFTVKAPRRITPAPDRQAHSLVTVRLAQAVFKSAHTAFKPAHTVFKSAHTALKSAHTVFKSAHAVFKSAHTVFKSAHTALKSAHTAFKSAHAVFMSVNVEFKPARLRSR